MATEFVEDFPDGMDPQVFMDLDGREVPNPNPIVIHLASGPVTDFDRVRELIRRELSIEAERNGEETMEEANDFDVEDDMFPVSAHEYTEDTEKADIEALAVHTQRQIDEIKRKKAKKAKKPPQAAPEGAPGVQGVADPLESGEEPGDDQDAP